MYVCTRTELEKRLSYWCRPHQMGPLSSLPEVWAKMTWLQSVTCGASQSSLRHAWISVSGPVGSPPDRSGPVEDTGILMISDPSRRRPLCSRLRQQAHGKLFSSCMLCCCRVNIFIPSQSAKISHHISIDMNHHMRQ